MKDKDFGEVYFLETDKDRENIQKFEKIKTVDDEEEFWEEFWEPWRLFPKEIENYKNSKYVLIKTREFVGDDSSKVEFFKNEDGLIFFALNEPKIAPDILSWHEEYVNPHYQVNNWIEKKYELKQVQNDISEQSQKFEEPKKKL
ncbi:hypothetical protein [Mesomycoplasma ovipneumoniae]|uniref:hypothetical protein n=1 Tax=Mesomycoplasma ovipneumoniae TaxID=29562 RepID=UPI00083E8C3D|nr:hypothetical protein [Mesomycoplasma ovipneumoniae]